MTAPDPAAILADLTQAAAAHRVAGGHQAPNSRYRDTPTAQRTNPDGTLTVHLRRRFLPDPEQLATLGRVTVSDGDRIDTLAAEVTGDPTQFWRLADGNLVLRPEELVAQPGRVIRVTAPEGLPGGGPGA